MFIEVRTGSNVKGSEQSSAEVKAAVHAALNRYVDRIRRVDVHLSDAIGLKAGHDDKRCMIEARRDDREPIVVALQESTMEQAIHGAVHNLKKAVDSALGKETTRDHLRDHH